MWTKPSRSSTRRSRSCPQTPDGRRRHAPTILVVATISLGGVILAESALSFLGYGVPPPHPSWGAMLSGSGRTYMYKAPWVAIWPGVAISLVVFGFNMLGDALRDVLDPRLRGGAR